MRSLDTKCVEHDPGGSTDRGGERNGDDPCRKDATRDAPSDGPRSPARTNAHDRARDDMGRGDGHAEVRGHQEHRCRRRLCGKPVDRLELDHPMSHRLHDAPAADGGAERDRRGGREHDPDRHVDGGDETGGEEREGDDAHRFLSVVRAVAQAPGAHQ